MLAATFVRKEAGMAGMADGQVWILKSSGTVVRGKISANVEPVMAAVGRQMAVPATNVCSCLLMAAQSS